MKAKVKETVNETMNKLKKVINKYSKKVKIYQSKLKLKTLFIRKIASNNIDEIEKEVMPKIDKLIKKTIGYDIRECSKIADNIKPIFTETIEKTKNCTRKIINNLNNAWIKLFTKAEKTWDVLVNIKKNVSLCGNDNKTSRKLIAQCVKNVGSL